MKTLLEKKKMRVTSIFSFYQNVFLPCPQQISLFQFILSSANAFRLDGFNILPFSKELNILTS